MFEPLPALIRLERERQHLTQDALSKLSGISRSRLASLEKGDDNLSLKLLVKVANTLGMKHLRIGGLHVEGAPPDLTVLLIAEDAIATARKVVEQATASSDELDRAAASLSTLRARVLKSFPDVGIAEAAERMVSSTADPRVTGQGLRDLAETPDTVAAAPRVKPPAKTARRRAR